MPDPIRARGFASSLCFVIVAAAAQAGAQPPPSPAQPPAPPPDSEPAPAQRYEPEGTALVIVDPDGTRKRIELGCSARHVLVHEGTVYAACGAAGVVVLLPTADGGLATVGRLAVEGEATEVFVHGGRLWTLLERVEARPLAGAPELPTAPVPPVSPQAAGRPQPTAAANRWPASPAGLPPARPTTGPRVGRVVATEPGEIIVDLGAADGIALGARIRLTLRRQREMGAGHISSVEEKLAVGEVVDVAPERARIELGLNEDVPLGAEALATRDELTSSLVAPPRPAGQWHLGLHARPFLALGDLAFGMLSTVDVGYRGEADWHLRLMGEPLGFIAGKGASLAALSAVAAGSYDHQLFEIGAGVGITRVAEARSPGDGPKPAFTIMPLVRLGAVDGFHAEVHNGFVVADEEFSYGSTTGTIQIPLARSVALQLRGGGGISGYGLGEAGLRVLAAGNGGRGSLFVSPSAGAAFMFGDHNCDATYCQNEFYGGPMIGLGLEYRP